VTALARAVGDPPLLKPPPRLDPLLLEAGSGPHTQLPEHTPDFGTTHDADWLGVLLASILTARCIIVVGAARPFEMLEWTMNALPLSTRRGASTTVGLKWSPARQIQLAFVDHADHDTVRALPGREVDRLDVTGSPPPLNDQPFESYLALIRRWWSEGRFGDIVQLGSLLTAAIQPEDLPRAAGLCNDIDAIKSAEPSVLDGIITKYKTFCPRTDVERNLLERLRKQAREQEERRCRTAPSPE
jgi:hypothetical protein